MAKAIAFTRTHIAQPLEVLRIVLVTGCAIALIGAGPVFPVLPV